MKRKRRNERGEKRGEAKRKERKEKLGRKEGILKHPLLRRRDRLKKIITVFRFEHKKVLSKLAIKNG